MLGLFRGLPRLALFTDNPLGGEPMGRIVLRQPAPGAEKSALHLPARSRPSKNPQPAAPSDQKTIAVIDGSSGKRQDFVVSSNGANKAATMRRRTDGRRDQRLWKNPATA